MRTNQPGRSTTPEEQDLMGYLVQAEDTGDEVCLTVENLKGSSGDCGRRGGQGRTKIKIYRDGWIYSKGLMRALLNSRGEQSMPTNLHAQNRELCPSPLN